tara:strand:- start:173 stop:544 length:372 start_codon:yes stop_codon:yes gene_type:complete
MKLIALAALTASAALATPATAGVFVNVEANSSRTGSNFESTVTDLHVGYEGGTENFGYYIQGGPAIVAVDGVDSDNRLSGKLGGSFQATEAFGVYGEISVLTADNDTNNDNSWGTKIGAKYSF